MNLRKFVESKLFAESEEPVAGDLVEILSGEHKGKIATVLGDGSNPGSLSLEIGKEGKIDWAYDEDGDTWGLKVIDHVDL